jgi:adenosylcobyric acid synthase
VLPYIDRLRIDQEDSVALEDHRSEPGRFRVGVIRLPHISNYTDFNPIGRIPDVTLEYLKEPDAAPQLDLVIIPGTKNTIADLRWLVARGFKKLLLDTVERGGWILGICGGFQMLGHSVTDPFGVEEGGREPGLALLPIETELDREKITVQSRGRSFLGPAVSGYEIHMGRSTYLNAVEPFLIDDDGRKDGAVSGRIAGTYFHGLFDNAEFTSRFLTVIAESRRLGWRPGRVEYSKEAEYDRLATIASEHLDVEKICALVMDSAL